MTSESHPLESKPRAPRPGASVGWGGDALRLVSIVLGLLCVLLAGCGRPTDVPAPRREIPREQPKPTVAKRTIPPPVQAATGALPEEHLPIYELKMAPRALAELEQSESSNDTHPASFVANGVVYDKVKVRFRGQWARTWPKKPLKIFFDHDQLFEGRRCLNLNSGWRDPAFIREPLAYHVYAACGVPSPRARMVRLNVNGQFRGLYVEVEQPDKVFLNRLNLKGASVFKAVSQSNQADERDLGRVESYSYHYKQETQKTNGLGELQSFCHELASTTNAASFFIRRVDVDKYINYLAATVLVQHWDCYNKNHFLLYDGRNSKKWWVVPWDLDRTFGDHWRWGFDEAQLPILLGTEQRPGTTGWNRMENRFLGDSALRLRFLRRLEELLEKEFTTEKLFPILDRFESDISVAAALDRARWPGPVPDLHSGIAQVKSYIKRRRAYLLGEIERLRQSEAAL